MNAIPIERVLEQSERATLAWHTAQAAGSFLLNQRPTDLQVSAKTSPTDPVTEMDRGAERIIVSHIAEVHPEDGFLGEEGSDSPGTSGVRWIIDPLDGTVNYLYGLPVWAVSIGAEVHGVGDVGVVAVPAQGETFIGMRGVGAWHVRDGFATRIPERTSPELGMALVGTGFGYLPDHRADQTRLLTALAPHVRDFRRVGACAVDLCWLAIGRFDAFYEQGVKPWDYSAGAVIAREAGCLATSLDSEEPSEGMILAAPAELHGQLRRLLREAR